MSPRGQRHVFDTMGTTVSLVFAGAAPDGAIDSVEAVFAALNRRFSLYRDDSEASAVARGELTVADASVKFRDAFALAERWRMDTEGAFTPHRPDGSIDLAGVIKAQAIQESGEALRWHGATAWCLNAGGDVLTAGVQAAARGWSASSTQPTVRPCSRNSRAAQGIPRLPPAESPSAASTCGGRPAASWRPLLPLLSGVGRAAAGRGSQRLRR